VTAPVRVVDSGEGAPMRGGSHCLKAGIGDTEGALTVWTSQTPYLKGPPLHLHELEDELFYVVAGKYELVCGSESAVAAAGSLMFLPRFTGHTFRCVSAESPGRLLHCCVPGGLELYFAAIGDSDAATANGRELRRLPGDRFGLRFPADPRELTPGAELEPPFQIRPEAEGPLLGTGATHWVRRLGLEETAGRVALDELFAAPGAAWRLPTSRDWRIAHLLSGEVELDGSFAASVTSHAHTTRTAP
jgi:mannose-6-phosphate isomerase-like protein (cupin superfamily)